ncbi:MAG TPA: hypothetical protein PLI01_02160 [Nitrospira sp.]|jgi:hypothetical protein|nr:hypothetical protein [Nitrospira sp.]MBS0177616.1 hypothetical protein [Nitrospira sp.]HNA25569.1 hypothetical protein [Nitrospira sp.]
MLVLLALGGITCVVWMAMLWLSFFDDRQIVLLRTPVKRSRHAVRDGKD